MGIPKFKVGDKVQIKDFPPTQNCLKIEAIHIYEDKIIYTVIPHPIPVVIKPMEIAEDRLELIGDYTIVVKSGEYGDFGTKWNSFYCSHFNTKEKAEEAILDLMTTQATELMMRHKDLKDIESIDISFDLGYIIYHTTDDKSYLIEYKIEKTD